MHPNGVICRFFEQEPYSRLSLVGTNSSAGSRSGRAIAVPSNSDFHGYSWQKGIATRRFPTRQARAGHPTILTEIRAVFPASVARERTEMLPRRIIPFINRSKSRRQGTERPQAVLQVGRDQELLRLRAKIISCAGYTVHSMTPEQVPAEIGKLADPRVWVFCHTLDFYELALLAVAIRKQPPCG